MTARDYQWVGVEGKKELGGGVNPLNRRDNKGDLPLGIVGGSSHILPQAGRYKERG